MALFQGSGIIDGRSRAIAGGRRCPCTNGTKPSIRTALIDSGWATGHAEAALSAALADLGYRPGDIRRFLITHM